MIASPPGPPSPQCPLSTSSLGAVDFFLPYQRRWIDDTSILRICEKSRQIGMTKEELAFELRRAFESRLQKLESLLNQNAH